MVMVLLLLMITVIVILVVILYYMGFPVITARSSECIIVSREQSASRLFISQISYITSSWCLRLVRRSISLLPSPFLRIVLIYLDTESCLLFIHIFYFGCISKIKLL